jgi:Holliday junction DNA helicase RuvA
MISRIEGELVGVGAGRAELRAGPFTYELLVPACELERLEGLVGTVVELHAMHYLESQGQGAAYVPRLVGFSSAQQRAFFEALTTVRGLGVRRALRALSIPHAQIARAIADRDLAQLTSLPEVGRRLAETMVAQLDGKLERFLEPTPPRATAPVPAAAARDAVDALTRLGETAMEARRLVERALAADPHLDDPAAIVSAAFLLREPAR